MFEKENNLIESIPYGFRDIFPIEAEERNSIRNLIKKEFESWGYGEIKTPVVEFTKNISAGVGSNWKDKLINFFDADGSLVSLRTDMTIPVARFAGMRMKKSQLPVRFCYFANSFRKSSTQKGEKREYNQAGLEFIGSSSYVSDAEILVILVNILKKLVPDNFLIGLGSISVTEAIYDWLDLKKEDRDFIKKNIILKNYAAIREYLEGQKNSKTELFFELLKPNREIKNIEELIKKTGDKKIAGHYDSLKKLLRILQEIEYDKYFIMDFGIIRDFDYYSGLLFEIYSSKINSVLGSGGRYDKLIKKFGLDVPATGFAIDIDLLHKSIKESNLDSFKRKTRILIYSEEKNFIEVLKISNFLKKNNIIAELLFEKKDDILEYAKEKKHDYIGLISSDFSKIEITDIKNDFKKTTDLNESEILEIIKK